MKNYTYGWRLKELGYVEVAEEQYTDRQRDMKEYIDILSEAVRKAKCGWDGVQYKLMGSSSSTNKYAEPYMVLCVGEHGERWIPIDGNSKGCCLSVLGENLW
jgi:hypothetical protein